MQDIYEVTHKYRELETLLNTMLEQGEIDEQCLQDTLKESGDDLENQCINLAKIIKNKEAYIAALQNRAKEIKEKLAQIQNRANREIKNVNYFKGLVEYGLRTLGNNIQTPDFDIKLAGKKAPVEIELDIEEVDPLYVITEVKKSVDKAKAYNDLRLGKEITGPKLGSNKRLDIK